MQNTEGRHRYDRIVTASQIWIRLCVRTRAHDFDAVTQIVLIARVSLCSVESIRRGNLHVDCFAIFASFLQRHVSVERTERFSESPGWMFRRGFCSSVRAREVVRSCMQNPRDTRYLRQFTHRPRRVDFRAWKKLIIVVEYFSEASASARRSIEAEDSEYRWGQQQTRILLVGDLEPTTTSSQRCCGLHLRTVLRPPMAQRAVTPSLDAHRVLELVMAPRLWRRT